MPYPLKFANCIGSSMKTKKSAPVPGEYDSVLIKIDPAPGYKSGQGYRFTYELTAPNTDEKFEKTELFLNDPNNDRTFAILSNIFDSGFDIQNVEDLLGLHETIILEYEVNYGRSYLNITNRKFIDFVALEDSK